MKKENLKKLHNFQAIIPGLASIVFFVVFIIIIIFDIKPRPAFNLFQKKITEDNITIEDIVEYFKKKAPLPKDAEVIKIYNSRYLIVKIEENYFLYFIGNNCITFSKIDYKE